MSPFKLKVNEKPLLKEIKSALEALAELREFPLEFPDALLDRLLSPSHIFCVNNQAAFGTGSLCVTCEPTELFSEFVAALRTGNWHVFTIKHGDAAT